jgi:hypothetical protein
MQCGVQIKKPNIAEDLDLDSDHYSGNSFHSNGVAEEYHHHHHGPVFKATDLIICHKSMGYKSWSKLIDLLCIISSFVYAHWASFRHSDPSLFRMMLINELAFLLDFALKFITSIEDQNNLGGEIRDFGKISQAYIDGDLFYDLIALIPFYLLNLKNNRQDLLYIVKLIRLKRGILNMEIMGFLEIFRESEKKKLERKMEAHPTIKDDIISDNTNIGKIMGFSFFLKFVEIIITICCCSYFFAMAFKLVCEIQNELLGWDNFNVDK